MHAARVASCAAAVSVYVLWRRRDDPALVNPVLLPKQPDERFARVAPGETLDQGGRRLSLPPQLMSVVLSSLTFALRAPVHFQLQHRDDDGGASGVNLNLELPLFAVESAGQMFVGFEAHSDKGGRCQQVLTFFLLAPPVAPAVGLAL